ncbi:MAG: fibronectin type III domain-containing protein, partial [Clostridiales bacterium]|nr:fibronectin type III domain-containing protein [Clostridiales bacterium]
SSTGTSADRQKTQSNLLFSEIKSGQVTVKWARQVRVTSYWIRYSRSKSMENAETVTVSGSSAKAAITGLKKKTYYIKVRSVKTIGGTTYYSQWSEVKKIKIK